MAKLFLDLKKMKKLASDDKTTTFQHIAGHKIVVARHPLSEQARKDMDAIPLAYGGNPKLEQSKQSPPTGKLPGEAAQHGKKGAGGMHVLTEKAKPTMRMADGGNVPDDAPFTQMPGSGGALDEGKMPQAGDPGYSSGEAKPDPLGNAVIDTAVTAGAAPLAGAMVGDAGAVAGNELGAVGKDLQGALADPGRLQKAMARHGLDENSTVGELLQKMSGKSLGQQTQAEMNAELAARNKQMLQQKNTAYTSKFPKKMAQGGVAHYADGTPDGGVAIPTLDPSLAVSPTTPPPPVTATDPNAIDYGNADYANQATAADAPYGTGPAAPTPTAAAPVAESNNTPTTQQPPDGPTPDPYGVNATAQTFQDGLREKKAGIFAQQQADSRQAAIQAKALQDNNTNLQAQQITYQNHYNALDKTRRDIASDIANSHIDPQHYQNSQGTEQRIGTALSLILGGIGSGFGKGGPNVAYQMLQSNIDRDMEAQKAELGKKENLLSALNHQFGNLKDSTDMYRMIQADRISNQLKQSAASTGDMAAKARALQASGDIDMSTAQLQGQMAMRKTILSGMQSGQVQPEQVIRAIVPDKEQDQARKELQTAQKDQALRNDTLKAFDTVNGLSTATGLINPQSYKQADAVWGATMDKLTKDTSGRVTPETVQLMSTLRPSTTDTASTTALKRSKLNDILSQNMHYPTLDTYGIKGFSNSADGTPGGGQFRTKPR